MTLTSQGRSAAALAGALSGSGTVTLEAAKIAGLDPRAFEVAVRANDSGQAKDDVRLKQIVEPALPAGALSVPSAQIPFTDPGRPAAGRGHHARRQWRAGHRLRRLRHPRRSGRHPRRTFADDDAPGVPRFSCSPSARRTR